MKIYYKGMTKSDGKKILPQSKSIIDGAFKLVFRVTFGVIVKYTNISSLDTLN